MKRSIYFNLTGILLGITVFLTPFYFLRFKIAGIPTNILELSIIIVFVLSFILYLADLRKSIERKQNPEVTRIKKTILTASILFIASALLGAWQADFSLDSLGIFKGWVVMPILLATAVSFQVTGASRDTNMLKPRSYNLKPLFWGLYASVLVVSLWAIAQKVGLITTLFYQNGDSTFNQYLGTSARSFGPFESPNYLAMFIIPSTMLALGIKLKVKSPQLKGLFGKKPEILKIIFYISLILPLTALILSKSRAGIITLVAVSLITAVILLWRKLRPTRKPFILISFIILSALFVILIYKFTLRPDSDLYRFEIYKNAWFLVKQNWLLGIGAGRFQDALITRPLSEAFKLYGLSYAIHPHNLYFALWLNFGLLGIISFLSLCGWALVLLFRNRSRSSLLIALGLIAILIHGFFDTTYFKNDLSVLFWLSIALAYSRKPGGEIQS